jgi:nitrogen-specific signal transduction histidine kinase
MTPVQIDMALSVIRLISNSIQERMKQHNELLELFETARAEGRDFTEDEVKLWQAKADHALEELKTLIPNL